MSKTKEKIIAVTIATLLPILTLLVAPQQTNVSYAVARVDADTVDGFHAAGSPVPGYLLALDPSGKFPVSVLSMGSSSLLDADLFDGLDSLAFVRKGEANTITLEMLADGSIVTSKIADSAVTGSKIANLTRVITANIMGWPTESMSMISWGTGIRVVGTGDSGLNYSFAIPYDYAGGDLKVREWWVPWSPLGTAVILRHTKKLTPDGQLIPIEDGWVTRHDLTLTEEGQRTWILPASLGFGPGDIIWIGLWRHGDNPADTGADADLKAVGVEYQSEQ